MKKIILATAITLFCITALNAQIVRPFSQRYYNASAKGNIVYVSNSIVSSTGIGPGTPGTGEVPPAGNSWNNAGNGINIDVDNPPPVTVLPFGSLWNYHAQNAAPANNPGATNWKQPGYIMPGTWNVGALPVNGPGKYGFNSGQVTCLPNGQLPICIPVGGNKYTSYYFRNTVNFTALELSTTYASILINLQRNDGIVVYINGVERIRDNMPGGGINYGTLASSNIAPGAAETISYSLSPSFFNTGVNTIAVEVHLRAANSQDMSFDMEVQGQGNNGTFNSSTSDLNLSTCSTVLFAGLYWGIGEGSTLKDSSWITGETSCKLKLPGASSYTTVNATSVDHYNATNPPGFIYTGYQCFANITSLINTTNPNGTYTVADVVSLEGVSNVYGGWTIVIAYANPTEPARNLKVFDGCVVVNRGNAPLDVAINGFLTPAAGPVSCELGAVVYDGDRAQTDSFSFKQNGAPAFYNLTPNATANLNDMWNSVISYKGAVVTTRNPAFQNTLGYDASIIELPNAGNAQLSNNQTSATVRLYSPSEYYIAQVLTTAITQYNPTFAFDKTATDINGGMLVPGDSLRYQLNYNNTGNDSSTNTIVIDNIPSATTFIPGSIKINGIAKTDAPGDDEAEYSLASNRVVIRIGTGANASNGGNVGPGVSGTIEFDVVIASSCNIIACTGSLRNSAKINYNGKKSGAVLYDSSGVTTAGCIVQGPVIHPLAGPCFYPQDTLLVNRCTDLTVMLPWRKYAGYTFYGKMPFVPANIVDPYIPVTSSGIFWAYYNNGSGCSHTARIQVIITLCVDIDDDDDGIPDYVEFDNPLALQDHNSNGIPNWNDPAYPGFVDNNLDAVNDNFDWGADSDNDGIPNFNDHDFWIPWVDADGDGVNDKSDKDQDGLPNQYDLDSDNDGIPDVVESYGVDTNGDGIIDNYIDTDSDGFSQNVDANNTGVAGSNVGLGPQDFDGDGIPNYLDLDSDNDGIPDIIESGGTDVNNDGVVDGFTDADGDGLTDNYFMATGLLKTGPDTSPVDGRADNYPFKNKDRDFRPNAYDMDSDGDGIVDVIEAGFPDANLDGKVDGTLDSDGWSTLVSSLSALGIRMTDSDPYPDYLDIDSDDDGIPDNIEGQSTTGYKLPVLTDTDGDGLVNIYDNIAGFGGSGIYVYDHNADGTPDYRDLDTDGDGLADIVEGNDFNLNGMADDDVSLTGLDTDGDGLDNKFDSLNSVTNIKGTSYRMGTGGTFTGDPSPGSRTTVQKTMISQTDRDWRFVGYVLPVQFLSFTGSQYNSKVTLNWTIIAEKEVDRFEIERSVSSNNFIKTQTVTGPVLLQVQQGFSETDDIAGIYNDQIYYRLKVLGKDGTVKYSNVIVLRNTQTKTKVTFLPNPTANNIRIRFYSETETNANLRMIDKEGKTILTHQQKVTKGINNIELSGLGKYSSGVYTLQIFLGDRVITQNMVLWN